MSCSHLLARAGACPCGWREALPAAPDPVPVDAAFPDPEVVFTEARAFNVEVRAERCRRSLAWFVREGWHVLEPSTRLEWGPHIQAVCDHVQWILEDWMRVKADPSYVQRARDAAFSLPPGVLKTRLIVEMAPAWMWLRDPTWTVTCLSKNPTRARDSARNSRSVITSDWYQAWFRPDWKIRDDQDALGDFGNTAGGVRKSRGIVAEIVGTRADALLVDDPNAPDDDDEALERVNALWDSTLYSRVNDLRISVHIIVQQRVSALDLTGHVTAAPGWMLFVLPLLFDPERACVTPFGWKDWRTVAGESLHPARFTPEVVATLRDHVLGPTMFEAQAQQNPGADDGEMFKLAWWGFWRRSDQPAAEDLSKVRPKGCRHDPAVVIPVDRWGALDVDRVCVTMDPTGGSVNEDASHVGLLVCAAKDDWRLVVDDLGPGPRDYHEQLSDLDRAIGRASALTGARSIKVLVEKKVLGPALLAETTKHVKEQGYTDAAGQPIAVVVDDYNPGKDEKENRAAAMEPSLVLGQVLLPEGAPWLAKFLAEFKRFPKKPNDRVDALAQFLDRYRKKLTWADAFRKAGR